MSRRPVSRWLRPAAVGLALVMLAAACDGDGAGGDGDRDGGGSTPASSSDEGPSDEESLGSFLGWADEDVDDATREAEWRDKDDQMQEAIRECMAEAGFEYIPVANNAPSFAEEGDEEEYASQHGFGITTWYGNETEVTEVDDGEREDPNRAITEAMSDAERQAYDAALWGTAEEQREGAEVEYDAETGEEIGWVSSGPGHGCSGQAQEEVWGGDDSQEFWEELQPAFEEMLTRVEADPRILEWNEGWARCMADAGHVYESPNGMHSLVSLEFQRRLDEIVGADGGYADPFHGWSEDEVVAFFDEHTEAEIDAFIREAESVDLDAIDEDALRALQQEEIDLALQDLGCRDGDSFQELYAEISAEYEAGFIAENRDLLEQIREAEGD